MNIIWTRKQSKQEKEKKATFYRSRMHTHTHKQNKKQGQTKLKILLTKKAPKHLPNAETDTAFLSFDHILSVWRIQGEAWVSFWLFGFYVA